MTTNYKEITAQIPVGLAKMQKEMPEVMGGFGALSKAASADGVLSKKTKELIALALAIGARCTGCIGFHTQNLIKLGVTREEFFETMGVAISMGGGPSVIYAQEALKAFEDLTTH